MTRRIPPAYDKMNGCFNLHIIATGIKYWYEVLRSRELQMGLPYKYILVHEYNKMKALLVGFEDFDLRGLVRPPPAFPASRGMYDRHITQCVRTTRQNREFPFARRSRLYVGSTQGAFQQKQKQQKLSTCV